MNKYVDIGTLSLCYNFWKKYTFMEAITKHAIKAKLNPCVYHRHY